MVVVARLLNPSWRIEIEANAVIIENSSGPPPAPARDRIRQIEKKALQKLRNPRSSAN
jgi:hypothetical protein